MATTRVYILAKELGVKSSAVVKKCQDEGLDVKNHMSVISAGLAATVREGFSEGENVTTVETSEKVDLEKVRIRRKKKKEEPAELEEIAVPQAPPEPAAEPFQAIEAQASATEPQEQEQITAVTVEEAPSDTTTTEPPSTTSSTSTEKISYWA